MVIVRAQRCVILMLLASCSSREREPAPPAGQEHVQAPPLTEHDKRELADRVIEQANTQAAARGDARVSPCGVPARIAPASVTGSLIVSSHFDKLLHLGTGEIPGAGELMLHAGAVVPVGRTSLRARRDIDDFERPIVIELVHEGRALDAVSGTLVITRTKPEVAGHLENADLRERGDDFAYVADGCTSHIERVDFVLRPRATR